MQLPKWQVLCLKGKTEITQAVTSLFFFFLSWDKTSIGKGDIVTNTTFPAYWSQNQPNIRKSDITADKLALNLFPGDALVGNTDIGIILY